MTILSLFDGMSCGRIALERAGLAVDKYVASEVDKYAVAVSRANWPDIIQLGSVTDLSFKDGVISSGIDEEKLDGVDLFIGGSPCQSFSFAGNRKGMTTKDNVEILSLEHYLQLKEGGFEFQGQSYLFWEYVRLLREVQKENPDVLFLLENVKMAKKWQDLISGVLGVEPIVINSALVSAQNRVRLYWTNIQGIAQPEDRGILLKHIIDYSVPFDRTFTPKDGAKFSADGLMVVGNADGINGHDIIKRVYSVEGKSPTVTAVKGGNQEVKIAKPVKIGNINPSGKGQNGNVYSDEGLSPCLTTVEKDCLLSLEEPGRYPDAYNRPELLWRKLTPMECERLQTVPDNYSSAVSNSQRYKMLGNGWTVDIITHIFKGLKDGI